MAKRFLDLVVASVALLACVPVLLIAAIGIVLSDPGPVVYRARRVGRDGRIFEMLKLRSMRAARDAGPSITATVDDRVFPWGHLLRRLKIDELPQLLHVVDGTMSLVGPRPEDPDIVAEHFTEADRDVLAVRPGLVSPGTLFYFTHGERLVGSEDPRGEYLHRVLPVKLELDRIYVRESSIGYDIRLLGRAALAILRSVLGLGGFPLPPEYPQAVSARTLAAEHSPPEGSPDAT